MSCFHLAKNVNGNTATNNRLVKLHGTGDGTGTGNGTRKNRKQECIPVG